MQKTMDIMKKEESPMPRRQGVHGALNGDAVNNAHLRRIEHAKTTSNVFPGMSASI